MNIIKYLTNIWTWRPKDIVGKVEGMNVEKNEGIVDEVVYFPHKEVIKEDIDNKIKNSFRCECEI